MSKKKSKKSVKSKKHICFNKIFKQIKHGIIKRQPKTLKGAIGIALKYFQNHKSDTSKLPTKRIIPIPKTGGILPLVPIFAGLSALGALAGGVSGIAKAINSAREARQKLNEETRHNRTMEAIALGKGLYLKQYKSGMGVFLGRK